MHDAQSKSIDMGPRPDGSPPERKFVMMLYTIATVLILLWLLGMVSAYTMSGFIHVLLVVAVVIVLMRIISGQKVI
jgi:hypothetical protein